MLLLPHGSTVNSLESPQRPSLPLIPPTSPYWGPSLPRLDEALDFWKASLLWPPSEFFCPAQVLWNPDECGRAKP